MNGMCAPKAYFLGPWTLREYFADGRGLYCIVTIAQFHNHSLLSAKKVRQLSVAFLCRVPVLIVTASTAAVHTSIVVLFMPCVLLVATAGAMFVVFLRFIEEILPNHDPQRTVRIAV